MSRNLMDRLGVNLSNGSLSEPVAKMFPHLPFKKKKMTGVQTITTIIGRIQCGFNLANLYKIQQLGQIFPIQNFVKLHIFEDKKVFPLASPNMYLENYRCFLTIFFIFSKIVRRKNRINLSIELMGKKPENSQKHS